MQEVLSKIRYFERGLLKSLKKVNFIFSFEPSPFLMDKVIINKRGLELVEVALQVTYQVQKYSFVHYILADRVWWCNVKQFLSFSKNFICKFMQVYSWHHRLFHFYLPFWILKVWKGREKITKNINILKTKRAF